MLFTSFDKKTKNIYRLIYILVLLITGPLLAQNQAFWVSTTGNDTLAGNQANPFATITHALSVIADQDTIRIEPGYYYEQLDISGLAGVNDFVMQGASLMDTIAIVSPYPGPVISIGMPLSNQTQFLNLFISHENFDSLGPGIEIFSSNPIIENCTVAGNQDNSPGGGIRIYSSGSTEPPVIRDCHIHNNTALGGGGIFAQVSSVMIKHSIIEFNDALGYEGGGIFLQGCDSSTITENQIHENQGNDGAGIYIDVDDTNPLSNYITNNLIFRNYGLNVGAGMYVRGSSTTNSITDNSFGENYAQGSGGGLFVEMAADIVLNRNLFVNNNSLQNGGGICFSDMVDSNIELWSNHISGNIASGEGGGLYLINCNVLSVGSALSLRNNFYHNRAGGSQNAITSGTSISTLNLDYNYWGFPDSRAELQININGSNPTGLVYELNPFDISVPLVEDRSIYYFGDGFIEFQPEAMTVTGSEYLGVKTTIDTVLSSVNDLNFLGKKYMIDFTGIDVFYPVNLFLYYDQSELDNAGNPPIEDLLITYFDGGMTEWYTTPSTYDSARQLIMANFSTFENSEFSIGFYSTMSDSMFEVYPEPNRTDIDAESTVDIFFKRDVDQSTLIPENINIFGQYSGIHTYTQKYDPVNYQLKLIPDSSFVPGEEVSVTLTANIFDTESVPFSQGFTWKYHIGAFLGNSQFTPGALSPIRANPIKHELADMTADHFPDLVELSMTQLTILSNNRLGYFTPFDSLSLAQQYRLIDVNDFDRDNIPDIVIANESDLWIYEYNYTTKLFDPLHNEILSIGGSVIDMVVEDFNNDAISDIFLLFDNGSNCVTNLFIADTSDGFYLNAPIVNNLPGYPSKIFSSDINNDGFLDIIGNSGSGSNDLTLLINQAGSSFSRIISSAMDVNYTTAIGSANIWNGYPYDMQREVIITGEQIGTYYPIVSIMNANPDGTLNILHNEVLTDYTVDMVAADLTSDGFTDVVVCNSDSSIQILQNEGNSFSILPRLVDDIGANEIMTADLDLDGDMDILAFEKTTITAQWQILRNTSRTNRTFYVDNRALGGNGDVLSPFQHIGDALVRTIDGDSIIVSGGGSSYIEHLYINKNLTLTSRDDQQVILQSLAKSNLDSAVVTVENTQRVEINNFTFYQDSLIDGAVPTNFIFGITAENVDSLILRNVSSMGMTVGMDLNNVNMVFNRGYLERNGFGIKAQNSDLNISHLDVERSRLGGMKINASSATLNEADFHRNAFDAIQYQGGIIAENNSSLKLRFYEISENGLANIILRNSTGDIKYGGIFDAFVNVASDVGSGVYVLDGSRLEIGNTVIGGNYRHGIYALNSDVEIQNNVIGKNDSLSAVDGSGIYIDGGNARVVNNIIGMNNGGIWINNTTAMEVDYNDFFDNTSDFVYGISEVQHNLFEYPLFVSDYLVFGGHYVQSDSGFDPWQFKLAPGSPLIDRGDPSIFNGDGSPSDIGMFGDVDTTFVLNYRPAPSLVTGDTSITISWNITDVAMDTLFQATVIFRSTQPNFIPDTTQMIALLDNSRTDFTDYNLEFGQIYYYKLAFVDLHGGVAGYSEEISGRLDFYEFNFIRRQEFVQLGQGDSLQRTIRVHNTGTLPVNVQLQNYAGLPSWLDVTPASVNVLTADSADFILNFSALDMPKDTRVRHTLNFVSPDYDVLVDSVIVIMLVSYRDLFPPQTNLIGTYPDTVRKSLLRFSFQGNDQVYTSIGTPPELLRYQYGLHRVSATDTIPVAGGITNQTTLTFNPLHDGRYFFRVAALDTSNRGGLGTVSQVGQLAYVFAGPTASPGNVWQMVSPSRNLEQFSSYLNNDEILAIKSWKNEEYIDVSPENIKYGKGYWIITNRSRIYNWDNMEFLQQDTTIAVNLLVGWNQIGNPWAWDISMDSCQFITPDNRILNYTTAVEEGVILSELYYNQVIPLRRYVRVLDDMLMPKYGYWIYANQAVRLRYDSNPESIENTDLLPVESIAKSANNSDVLINLKAQSGKFADSENFFGICNNLTNYDQLYYAALEPPVMSSYLYLYNLDNDIRWSGSFKEDGPETEEWDIRLERGDLNHETILTWDWIKSSDENHMFLYHLETAQWFDMSKQESYTFNNKKKINHFKLYASEDENFKPEVLPVKFALSQNYPNPFNMQTTIELAVPYFADKHQAKLIVYDILGRQVKILHSGPIASGHIKIHWDGKNDAGVILASGLYIFRFTSDDFTASKKMILIK